METWNLLKKKNIRVDFVYIHSLLNIIVTNVRVNS